MVQIDNVKACLRRGDLAGARKNCVEILTIEPDNADALHLLGAVLAGQRDYPNAILHMEAALCLDPDRPLWHSNLGMTCFAAERWDDAAKSFARARALGRNTAGVLLAHARALLESVSPSAALNVYREAECLAPVTAGALRLLGRIQTRSGEPEAALFTLRESLARERNSIESHDLLADLYRTLKQDEKALEHYQASVSLQPNSARAHGRLAISHWDLGETAEAVALSEKALSLDPTQADVRSGYLFVLLHDSAATPERVAAAHRAWPEHHGVRSAAPFTFSNSRDTGRRLKIGYLSSEFLAGPFYHFIKPIMDSHDTHAFEVFCYNTWPSPLATGPHFERPGLSWHELSHLSSSGLAERIRDDGIDILVDACGHFPNNRLETFTQRPAPIQVAFPNYPATTGLNEIDYLLTDRWTDPPGMTESQYTEELYRVKSGYLPYLPPSVARPVTPLPALRNGHITFGLLQRQGKLNAGVWDAIAEVLRAVPDSRLFVHYSTRDLDHPGSRVRRRLSEQAESRGVSAARLDFEGAAPLAAHLDLLARADIALDTFPYNGQTTTCECLWMGVPVVSLAGNTHVSRVGYGILHRVGLGDWVGDSAQDYVEIAKRKAGDPEALAALRGRLREQMAASSMLDSAEITRAIEEGYRWMWQRWCR